MTYPKVTLLEQLGSSLPIEELHLNTFWNDVFQAYKQLDRKIQVESSDELAAEPAMIRFRLEIEVSVTKTGLTMDRFLLRIF